MQFTPKSEDELKAMMLSSGGVYDFEVESAEDGISKKGNEMIVLKLTVYTADGTEHFIRDWLVGSDHPLQLAKLQNFCKTTGMMEHYNAGTLTALACNGLAGKCKITITDSPQYGQQKSVADYIGNCPTVLQTPMPKGPTGQQTKRANEAAASLVQASQDDEIPF